MDSQRPREKSVKEKMNKEDYKWSSVVFHRAWFTLLGLFALPPGSQSLEIKGNLHQDVLLPCVVDYTEEFDYNLLVVNWQTQADDTLVHIFYYNASHPEDQDAHYRGRTQIFYDSLPNGNASLLLKGLTKSDAGIYICYVMIKHTIYRSQSVNLIVEDAPVAETKHTNTIPIVASLIPVLALVLAAAVVLLVRLSRNRPRTKDDEVDFFLFKPDPIDEYRSLFKKNIYQDIYERHFIVKGNHFTTFQSDVSFGDKQKTVKVKELFTPENKPFMSKRMLLVGDAGTGKSYFSKWLEQKWVKQEVTLYRCVIYVSVKRIETEKEETSVNKIVEKKCKGLGEVLDMSDVLLILDELDDLEYDASVTDKNSTQEKDNNTDLHLNTLITSIISKQLLPNTDVLIVCRHDSPIGKRSTNYMSTFVLQEFNDDETHDVYYNTGHDMDGHMYNSLKDISNNPAFFIMMCKFNMYPEKLQDFTSPYELLVSLLQQYLVRNNQEVVECTIRKMAEESYQHLVKGEQKRSLSAEQWDDFLEFFSCDSKMKYHCAFLKDMLAALHCVWEIKPDKCLKDCLDFWLFGAPKRGNNTCSLLSPVAEEHHAKYYHFIRFFMRFLSYPDYKSLRTNTRNMDDNIRKILRKYLNNILYEKSESNENYEKLSMVHCVFELHDDHVTEELSSIKHFSLLNTPLNSLDIRAIAYSFKDVKLRKLDLRLCALTDKNVEQLKNIIKNTNYVLLSSNKLTLETGSILKELLEDSQCLMEKLALGTNSLGPYGAQTLWKALEHNTSLQSLYLYDNDIGDNGTTGMVEHLENNNSLKELHLCLNVFAAKAAQNIKHLKAKKTKLKVVVTISGDRELFEYTEKKIEALPEIWRNYNQKWLLKLLEAVHADLRNKQWGMDEGIHQGRLEKLIKKIESTMAFIKKETSPSRGDIMVPQWHFLLCTNLRRSVNMSPSSVPV